MSYHEWGDEWPHWDTLYEAQRYIGKNTWRYAKIRILSKEKYGTIRYEHFLGIRSFMFYGNSIEYKILSKIPYAGKKMAALWFRRRFWIFPNLRFKIFEIVLYCASRKYPQVAAEILDDIVHMRRYDKCPNKLPWFTRPFLKENPWRSVGEE